jgi:anion-transporting  ArsA/GET3 family ATPase
MDAIGERQIVLCAGPGGVGKTTSSAAIALAAAQAGKRVLVLTIDPARRLADALGIRLDEAEQSTVPKQISAQALRQAGLSLPGELSAMMLDAARTMDDLVRRLSPTESMAHKLLTNVVYQHISRALAGALEYTAVEKLYDLRTRFHYDLIVVDTPPSKNVLDFIEAPEYLARFLDDKIIKWFALMDPAHDSGGFGAGLLKRTGRFVWEVLSRVFGRAFLTDVVDFVGAMESITGELRRRAEAISALLRSKQALFFIVANTDELVLRDASFLRDEIARRGIPFGGFIINRVHVPTGIKDREGLAAGLNAAFPPGTDLALAERVTERVLEVCAKVDEEAANDLAAVSALRSRSGFGGFIALLPRQTEEINDLPALSRLSSHFLPPAVPDPPDDTHNTSG